MLNASDTRHPNNTGPNTIVRMRRLVVDFFILFLCTLCCKCLHFAYTHLCEPIPCYVYMKWYAALLSMLLHRSRYCVSISFGNNHDSLYLLPRPFCQSSEHSKLVIPHVFKGLPVHPSAICACACVSNGKILLLFTHRIRKIFASRTVVVGSADGVGEFVVAGPISFHLS
jgi:hypothetical protein